MCSTSVNDCAQVVVELILDMKRLGHPSYIDLQEEAVVERSLELPEHDIPPEVVKLMEGVEDPMDDKLQPQKAAAPVDGRAAVVDAGRIFAEQRPRAIVAEGNRDPEAHRIEVAALADMQDKLTPTAAKMGASTLEVRTGNQLIDQFQPYYFAVAFPFCFKYATACPDVRNTTQEGDGLFRRRNGNPDAPVVDVFKWAQAMVRRVETQFRRDWTFGFTLWNYLFRTKVNLQPNTYVYAVPDEKEPRFRRMLNNDEIAEGARELMGTLNSGKYVDITGELKAIQGDLTKVRHAPTLSLAARKVLGNMEARARNIPGTHEVRKTMRHQTHACRVGYGTAIFVTMSPSERDSTLMVRLTRARQSDPAVRSDGSGTFQQRDRPALDVDYVRLSPEAFAHVPWMYECQTSLGLFCV